MKKKFVVALVAAMSLTVAGTGTVFAMDKVSTVASEKEHVHGDNCEWIVDKEAWTETVEHPEETIRRMVVDKSLGLKKFNAWEISVIPVVLRFILWMNGLLIAKLVTVSAWGITVNR